MIIKCTLRSVVVATAGGLFVAAALASGAQAVTDTVFKYTAVKTGYLFLGNMAMIPWSSGTANSYINSADGLTTAGTSGCFNASVNLPNGATITQLSFYFASGAASDPVVFLIRNKVSDGTSTQLVAEQPVSNTGARRQVNFPVNSVVNNVAYTYGFQTCLGNGDTFYAARIGYTYTNAGD